MKTVLTIALIAAPLFAAAAPPAHAYAQRDSEDWLAQCRRNHDGRRERACDVRTETFRSSGGAIRVDVPHNGGVSVESWSGTEIEVESRIQADAPDASRAAAIARGVRESHNGNTINTTGPDTDDNENWSVMYVIKVPRSSDLELSATNGPVSVRNVRGHIVASTVNGPLSITDVAGDVRVRTRNGPLTVNLAGARWEGTGLDAETSNGPVTLAVPEYYSADLETGTTNGPFSTDIPLNVRMLGERSTRINTKLGDGGAPVRVVTSNGPISIQKR